MSIAWIGEGEVEAVDELVDVPSVLPVDRFEEMVFGRLPYEASVCNWRRDMGFMVIVVVLLL